MTSRADLQSALELVDAVRRVGVDGLTRNLARRKADHVVRLTAVLAALVPDDKPVSELLAWVQGPSDEEIAGLYVEGRDARLLKPCGTHAAYERHRKRGELIDDTCVRGERAYQRARRRRERAA